MTRHQNQEAPASLLELNFSTVAALIWIVVGFGLGTRVPQGEASLFSTKAALFWITAGMILLELVSALRVISHTGRITSCFPVAVVLYGLFTLLLFQLGHLDSRHFHFKSQPHWWHWLELSFISAVKGGDLGDFLSCFLTKDSGFVFQTITVADDVSRGVMLAFRGVMAVLLAPVFIKSALAIGAWVRRTLSGSHSKSQLSQKQIREVVLLWCAVFLVCYPVILIVSLHYNPWRTSDFWYWLSFNFIRVVDFFDYCEVYNVRKDKIPFSIVTALLTMGCRAFFLLITWGVVRLLKIWLAALCARVCPPLTLVYSRKSLENTSAALKDLRERNSSAGTTRPTPLECQVNGRLETLSSRRSLRQVPLWCEISTGTLMVLLLSQFLPSPQTSWNSTAQEHAVAATLVDTPEEDVAEALETLKRMGPQAGPGVLPVFQVRFDTLPRTRQLALVSTAGHLGDRSVEFLEELAQRPDQELALAAVLALERIGGDSAPTLVSLMESSHPSVSKQAKQAVLRMGAEAVAPLIQQMDPENSPQHVKILDLIWPYWPSKETSQNPEFLRWQKIKTDMKIVMEYGSSSQAIGESLKRLAREHESALDVLSGINGLLNHEVSHVRLAAANVIVQLGEEATSSVPHLVARLNDPNPAVSAKCIEALAAIGTEARSAIPDLVFALGTASADKEQQIRAAMKQIGHASTEQVDPLIQLLRSKEPRVQSAAAESLAAITPAPTKALPVLLPIVGQLSEAAESARKAIVEIGAPSHQEISELLELLDNPQPEVRKLTIDLLGKLGAHGNSAVDILLPGLIDPNPGIRAAVHLALDNININWRQAPSVVKLAAEFVEEAIKASRVNSEQPYRDALVSIGEPALTVLLPELVHQEKAVREMVAAVLQQINEQWPKTEAAQASLSFFMKQAEQGDRECRRAAVLTLGLIGQEDPAVILLLTRLLSNKSFRVRQAAVESLVLQGPEALPLLLPHVGQGFSAAAKGVEVIGPPTEAEVQSLIPLLQHPNFGVRAEVARLLGLVEGDVSAALIPLIQLVDAPTYLVRKNAQNTLRTCSQASAGTIPDLVTFIAQSKNTLHKVAAIKLLARKKLSSRSGWRGQTQLRLSVTNQLLISCQDGAPEVRAQAALSIPHVDPVNPEQVERCLLSLFRDEVYTVRRSAARAVAQALPHRVYQLSYLLNDKSFRVRVTYSYCFYELEPQKFPSLLRQTRYHSRIKRMIEERAETALPLLIPILTTADLGWKVTESLREFVEAAEWSESWALPYGLFAF